MRAKRALRALCTLQMLCRIAPFCLTLERRCVSTAAPRGICTKASTYFKYLMSLDLYRDVRLRRSQPWASAMWPGEASLRGANLTCSPSSCVRQSTIQMTTQLSQIYDARVSHSGELSRTPRSCRPCIQRCRDPIWEKLRVRVATAHDGACTAVRRVPSGAIKSVAFRSVQVNKIAVLQLHAGQVSCTPAVPDTLQRCLWRARRV
jgi:hypothetical protein